MNPRTQRARQMMQEPGYAIQTAPGTFKVRSQTDPSKSYLVKATADGLICECKDHEFWRADCKHIKIVLETIRKNRCYRNNTFRIMERSRLDLCRYCDSGNLKKMGFRRTKAG